MGRELGERLVPHHRIGAGTLCWQGDRPSGGFRRGSSDLRRGRHTRLRTDQRQRLLGSIYQEPLSSQRISFRGGKAGVLDRRRGKRAVRPGLREGEGTAQTASAGTLYRNAGQLFSCGVRAGGLASLSGSSGSLLADRGTSGERFPARPFPASDQQSGRRL